MPTGWACEIAHEALVYIQPKGRPQSLPEKIPWDGAHREAQAHAGHTWAHRAEHGGAQRDTKGHRGTQKGAQRDNDGHRGAKSGKEGRRCGGAERHIWGMDEAWKDT